MFFIFLFCRYNFPEHKKYIIEYINLNKIYFYIMEDEFLQSGLTAIMDENYNTAIDYFSKIISKNEKHYKALLFRGVANVKKGDYDSALADLNKAEEIREKDTNDDLFYFKGVALFYSQELEKAKEQLEKALTMKTNDEHKKEIINKYLDKINKN